MKLPLSLSILLFPISAFAANVTELDERLKDCRAQNNDACIYAASIELYEQTDQKLVDPNGNLLIAGAVLEASLRKAGESFTSKELKSEAERTLTLVNNRHKNTPFMMATIHMLRVEACQDLNDKVCLNDSQSFLCEHLGKLALPTANKKDKPTVINRVIAASGDCNGKVN